MGTKSLVVRNVNSSNAYTEITCATCGIKIMKRSDFVEKALREGRKTVCSRLCAVPHRKPSTYKALSLEEYSGKNRVATCKLCEQEYPIKEFIKDVINKHKKFRKSFFCSKCLITRKIEYRLKAEYGMKSIDEYDKMIREQNNLCAICEKEMNRPCVDHNHLTGQVRQLLCVQCNAMLGQVNEDVAVLIKAVSYLQRW